MTAGVSSDGSPVEPYALLPAEPELSVVRRLLGERGDVLDLGAGTGRIADPLAAEGRRVVVVDESEAMLSRVTGTATVHSRIEDLDLGRTFEAVLLLSHLVNGAAPQALVATAARHLAPGGILIVQRLAPGRHWQEGSSRAGPVLISLSNLSVERPRITARTTYRLDTQVWHQDWVLVERGDDEIALLFDNAGLELTSSAGAWVVGRREGSPGGRN